MKKTINIGLLGLGNVGQGVVNLLKASQKNPTALNDLGVNLHLHSALVRNLKSKRNCDLKGIHLTTHWQEIVENPEIDVLIEVIGGVSLAFDITKRALELNKPVISANKALLCEKGHLLFPLSEKSKGYILFEAAVAGAMPIIRNLRHSIVSEKVESVVGILNGTSNFILSTMSQTKESFELILKQAQQLGYAEADPTFDIEGIDAAHKLVLISKLAFAKSSNEIFYQGISQIKIEDMKYAKSLGYAIKHLAIADYVDHKLNLRVHPALVSHKELIAKVSGAMNTVSFRTTFSGEHLFYGAGAGGNETASSILADLAEAVLHMVEEKGKPHRSSILFEHPISIRPISEIEEIQSRYYLRLQVLDIAGILATISQDLNHQGISIDVIHQDTETQIKGKKAKEIVIITHETKETAIKACLAHFRKLDSVVSEPVMIRVYN